MKQPIHVIVYYPSTEEGQKELLRRIKMVDDDITIRQIKQLNCSEKRKAAMIQALYDARRKSDLNGKGGKKTPSYVKQSCLYDSPVKSNIL